MDSLPIVVPVRFAGGGLTMQTTSSRMSLEAVFVRCLVSPKEGAEVALQLMLPSEEKPVLAKGTVTESIPIGVKGKEAGFWARLSADASERAKLEAFLGKKGVVQTKAAPQPATPQAPVPVEPSPTRVFPRLRSRLKVNWASPREFLVAYSENISRGGIFIALAKPPALGEVVELSLDLPDSQAPAQTYAQVIQRTTAEEAKASGRAAGAGLQFIGADDDFRRRLDACIENLLK
jgi:uncharacterized protein (TIGR02266 family)